MCIRDSGIAKTFNEALYKAFLGAGINLPKYKNMKMCIRDRQTSRPYYEQQLVIANTFNEALYKAFLGAGINPVSYTHLLLVTLWLLGYNQARPSDLLQKGI